MFGRGRNLGVGWLACALVLSLLVACSGESAPGPYGRGVYVDAVWKSSRDVVGHRVHVVKERIACVKCHELTPDAIGPVTPKRCAACHEKESRIEHAALQASEKFGLGTLSDCTTCHAFVPSEGAEPRAHECQRCHLERQGTAPAVLVHSHSECVKCHKPHENAKPAPGECGECHSDVKTTHAARNRGPIAVCTSCHQHKHAPAAEARTTCVMCHQTQQPIVPATAIFAEGHSECIGCHRPHTFEKVSAVGCRGCHADLAVLGAPRVKQHNQCSSCHAPHDVKGTPERACANCHKNVHPDHPKQGSVGTCVGCHDPHPRKALATARVRPCSTCHQAAATDKGFHAGTDCKKCHTQHDFVRTLADHSNCQGCHKKQLALVAANRGHDKCQGCHAGLPHKPTRLGAGCDACHRKQQDEVNRGHGKCLACHEPHAGSLTTACRSCHANEHRTAPPGHQACNQCHQAHSGSTAKVKCATCHADAAKSAHGMSPGGCTQCHRAHGPSGVQKAPACATCHKQGELAGLHKVKNHQTCQRCHTGHGERAAGAERKVCLSCHAERKNHFPDAARCANCHLFQPAR